MRIVYLVCFLCTLSNQLFANQNDLYRLFSGSDVVVVGNIIKLSGGVIDDLGTEIFQVSIQVNSIYKQNFPIHTEPLLLQWEVSNLHCDQKLLIDCIQKYTKKEFIFFIHENQLSAQIPFDSTRILEATDEVKTALSTEMAKLKRQVNHYNRNKTCTENCRLCHAIYSNKWKQVSRYLSTIAKEKRNDPLIQHRRIKWVLGDRSVLASLPTYYSVRLLLLTATNEVEALAHYQLGYTRSYAPWIPRLIYQLGWGQANRYFTKTDIDRQILLTFKVGGEYSDQYLFYTKQNQIRMLTDTINGKSFGPIVPLPDELVLLSSVFEDEFRFHIDYQTMPDYMFRAQMYVSELKQKKHIYSLCVLANHTLPQIGEYALIALSDLDDERAIPFLVQLAKYKRNAFHTGYLYPELHIPFMQQLTTTLNKLTGCHRRTNDELSHDELLELSQFIPLWEKRFSVID